MRESEYAWVRCRTCFTWQAHRNFGQRVRCTFSLCRGRIDVPPREALVRHCKDPGPLSCDALIEPPASPHGLA